MNALVTKLLAKDPEDRYSSADELADDLWRMQRGLPPVAVGRRGSRTQPTAVAASNLTSQMPPARPSPAPIQRKRSLPWLLVAILFILGLLGILQAVMGPDAMNGWFDAFQGDKQPPPAQPSSPEKVKVPEVAGLTRDEAEQKLTSVGLKVGEVGSIPSDSVAAGTVISPGIDAGTPVEPGTEVNLTVSSGPQPSSSASSSASAQSSPGATATASSSASAQPAQQEDRPAADQPAADQPAAKEKAPRVNVPQANVQKGPSVQVPNVAAPAEGPGNSGRGRGHGKD
jgi:serine/threonine protein kinase